MLKRCGFFLSLCFFSLSVYAANLSFTEGKEYKTIAPSVSIPARLEIPKGKILVTEFFSYGCPWCFHLEPTLEKWLKHKPDNVVFERVPVVFERGWDIYAKAYYAAEVLGKLDQITPAIFNAIHEKDMNLASEAAMRKFFESHGVSQKDFNSAFNFSPSIAINMQRSKDLVLAYKVFAVPTLIINGKYYTNAMLTKGDDKKLIQVVNYLIKKEKVELGIKSKKQS